MNAQDIWAGNEYAVFENKGRNDNFRMSATRVRVIRVFKKTELYNSKSTTYVECVVLDTETGEPRKTIDGEIRQRTIRARDFASHWDNYQQEREYRTRAARRLEEERQQREADEEAKKEAIRAGLENKGIDRLWVISISEQGIYLNRHRIEEWIAANGS